MTTKEAPALTVFENVAWTDLVPGAFFLAACVAGAFLCARLLGPLVAKAARRLNHPLVADAAQAFLRPAAYSLAAIGVYGGVKLLPAQLLADAPWLGAVDDLCAAACIVFFTWGLVRAGRVIPELIVGMGSKLDLGLGKALANFLTRIYQAVVLFIAAAMVLGVFGFNVNGVLAGLGLGGLSFALAGQDFVSNLFGGVVLITERPFEIGDWVATPDVEGTVEDITLRSTRIRTLDGTLTTVPNQKFSAAAITNWSRMDRRLAKFTLGLEYRTRPDDLRAVLKDVREMLCAHPHVHADTVQARLLDFGASSLDVTVQFYTKDTAITEYRAVREDINFRILDILAAHQVSLAFPSRSIYFAENPQRSDPL